MKNLVYNQNKTQQTKYKKQEILYFQETPPTNQDEHDGAEVTSGFSLTQNCCDML